MEASEILIELREQYHHHKVQFAITNDRYHKGAMDACSKVYDFVNKINNSLEGK